MERLETQRGSVKRLAAAMFVMALASAPAAALQGEFETPAQDALESLPSYGWAFGKMIVVLAAIIAALLLAAKLLAGRWGRRTLFGRGHMVEVVEITRLEARKSIYLIKVAGQFFLVGVTENGIQTLAGGELNQELLETAVRNRDSKTNNPPTREAPKRSFMSLMKSGQ